MRYRVLNPDDTVTRFLDLFNQVLAFVCKFLRVRGASAKYNLRVLVDLRDSLDQLADSLLAGNAADEQHIRTLRIHAPLLQNFFVKSRLVKVRIDTVVDNLHAIFRHTVKFHHVALHAFAHSNYAVGSLVRSAFNPAAHIIAAITQLFRFPRAVRFQRMRRENQRALQQAARHHATEMAIPRMAMNHVDILERRHPLEIDVQRLQDFLEAFVRRIAI